jgi:hypothetical protein
MSHPWLIFSKSTSPNDVQRIFGNVTIRMDSNVKVVVPEKNKNTFKVLDVYNPGVQIGEKPIITEIGLWNGSNLNINRNMTFYLQRKNMSSIQLRSGSVVLISNHSGTFEEYMLDARYIQFDTISKFHYSMFLLLEDVHNFT